MGGEYSDVLEEVQEPVGESGIKWLPTRLSQRLRSRRFLVVSGFAVVANLAVLVLGTYSVGLPFLHRYVQQSFGIVSGILWYIFAVQRNPLP